MNLDHRSHRLVSGLREGRQLGSGELAESDFLLEMREQPIAYVPELSVLQVSRMRRRDIDDLDRPSGGRREQHDAVGEPHRLVEIVRDEHDRRLRLPPPGQQVALHDSARLVIEAAERLVHQQQPWGKHECARKRDPLAHPAAQLARDPVHKSGEPNMFQLLVRPTPGFTFGKASVAKSEGDVVPHSQPVEQVVLLKDQDGVASWTDHVFPVDCDPAATGVLQASDQLQQRRLATASGADQRRQGTRLDGQVDLIEGPVLAEVSADGRNANLRHPPPPRGRRVTPRRSTC